MKFLGLVELAPFNIPMERRIQTLGVLLFEFFFFQGVSLVGIVTVVGLFFTRFYWLSLLYMAWYVYDFDTCNRGGRRNKPGRTWRIWKYFCEYFPQTLVKTVDLPAKENYLFCVHPHGVMSFSAFGNFATEGTGFSKKFPGLIPHLLVLKEQFFGPFMRDLLLMSGTCAASVASIKYILGNQGKCKPKGQVCVLIIGGAAESLEAKPGRFKLVLKNRKGFIRLALETGTSLVPVFSFGENEVFFSLENPENSRLRRFQNIIKTHFHFGLPIICGRGIFNYSFGLLPHRKPMHTVIGAPIKVAKVEAPTREEIDALHALYISKLNDLFEEHKEKYLVDKTVKLQID